MAPTISIEWAPTRDAIHERMDKICREQLRSVGNHEAEAELRAEHYASLADELAEALGDALLRCDELIGALRQDATARTAAALKDVNELEASARAALTRFQATRNAS